MATGAAIAVAARDKRVALDSFIVTKDGTGSLKNIKRAWCFNLRQKEIRPLVIYILALNHEILKPAKNINTYIYVKKYIREYKRNAK